MTLTDDTDRYLGCLLGLATGDALGTTLEFRRPAALPRMGDKTRGMPVYLSQEHILIAQPVN